MRMDSLQVQIDILALGLRSELQQNEFCDKEPFYSFASYFVDDNENLIYLLRILNQSNELLPMTNVNDYYVLLLFFILMTFPYRKKLVQETIIRE